jgi:hypothetical protein
MLELKLFKFMARFVSNERIDRGIMGMIKRDDSRVFRWLQDTDFFPHSSDFGDLQESFQRLRRDLPKLGSVLARKSTHIIAGEEGVIRATATHENPAIAALAKAFDDMQQQPLVRKFRRKKMELFIIPDDFELNVEKHLNLSGFSIKGTGLERILIPTAGAWCDGRSVLVPQSYLEKCSHDQNVGIIAHEIFHHLRGDTHLRRMSNLLRRETRHAEELADMGSGFLSGKPRELAAAVRTLNDEQLVELQETTERLAKERAEEPPAKGLRNRVLNWLTNRHVKSNIEAMERKILMGTADYPPDYLRTQAAETLAAHLETESGRNFVQAELERRLHAEHKKLWPHLYEKHGEKLRNFER